MAVNRSFGQCLLRYRTAQGLTQAELAETSGMSVRALRNLERGRSVAAQERSAEVLADALGLVGHSREAFVLLAREGRRRSPRTGGGAVLNGLPVVPVLVGREAELGWLAHEAEAGGVVVVVGPPGVGKTSLVVVAAERLAARFPDGCLALDLRGVDDHPLPPASVLERMLTALGVPTSRVPAGEHDRGSLFRTLLRDRRMLVILDNAADEAQVRPLLGGGAGCLTIVTCRRVLAGLEAARWLTLDVLSDESAVDFLAAVVGAEVVRGEAEEAEEVVALCGGLPLAVRIVGNLVATRGPGSFAQLARRLRDEHRRLDSLAIGDLRLRSVFEVSLRRLSTTAQTMFRRLALIPGSHFDDDLAAVAAGMPADQVDPALDELVEASLLTVTSGVNGLQFHDLIRLFARERLASEEDGQVRDDLRRRLYTHILTKGAAAGNLFFPGPSTVPADSPFQAHDEAREWLDHGATNWLAVQAEAADLGWHREVVDFTKGVHYYYIGRESRHRWDEVFWNGVRAARALGDSDAEILLLTHVGSSLFWSRTDAARGLATLREALALAEETGNRLRATIASSAVGFLLVLSGRVEEGLPLALWAYKMSADYDFFAYRFWSSLSYGGALQTVGRFEEALEVHSALLREVVDRQGQTNEEAEKKVRALALMHVGDCLAGVGRWAEAARHYRGAATLVAAEQPGYRSVAELALAEGVAWRNAGDHGQARTCLSLAVGLFDDPAHREDRERASAELALLPD
ncbi:NB-ARC domain-containing protein [Actinokineospora sp. 24-640]